MQHVHELTSQLAALAPLAELAATLARSHGWLRVAPLITAARTPTVAALARQPGAPRTLLYVTNNADNAGRAAEDLRQWLDPAAVLLYPANDAMPYEHMSPGTDVLAQRMRVLQRLAGLRSDGAPQAPTIIVAPVRALLQPTLTLDEYAYATTSLQRGQQIDQDELLGRWLNLGYRNAPAVDVPGELNRRGGIVDIWPMGDEQPLRIEWFGDEIDSLRRFDAVSQRSEQRLNSASVGPPHEFPLWNRERALARIRSQDVSFMRQEARDEWELALERLERGERFEGRAFYAPFFRDAKAYTSLLEHLPTGTPVFYSEALLVKQAAADFDAQADKQRLARIESNELPPDFPRPYMRWDELMQTASRQQLAVDLSNNELDSDVPAYQVAGLHFSAPPLFGGQFKRLVAEIVGRLERGEQVLVVTPQAARVQELVHEALANRQKVDAADPLGLDAEPQLPTANPELPTGFSVIHGALDEGWHLDELNLTLFTDTEIFGIRQRRTASQRRKRRERSAEERAAFLRGLQNGDYVVHIEHGIAVYEGLLRRAVGGVEREYLSLRYAGGDRLYVPVDQVDRVARYIGAGDNAPQLTRLGTQEWERAKRKARAAVQDLADDLLAIYAQRQLRQGHTYPPDNEWQLELEASFPYTETDDQLHAINDVKHDMEAPQPMDRLICGDVGFGKTEVALRAAFKAVQDNKQVSILVPTTVLAQQHFDTFTRRMAAFPVAIEMLSRFRNAREQDEIVKRLAAGKVDIVIGTHRLLSKDVHFKDLGLVIVDEEQRFGVRHKERLKQLRAEVDVLTLTATPIPRTLHMSLAGIRDLSVIDTPPEDRVPIKTYVVPYDDNLIRDAICREMERGGQIYFVHNRVQSIYHVANHIRTLVPDAEIGVGHGQLDEKELERVMIDFFHGDYDVLVCTTIIESGLDVPNCNTIIIDDATNYGLAQLYQLRGRVGRSASRAYAYLLYKGGRQLTEEAQQRLQAIQEATELGAGFRIAMRDLEIRGAGNLLGGEQSGHIAAVGFDLYSRLLEQAVSQLKERYETTGNWEQAAAVRRKPAVTNGNQADGNEDGDEAAAALGKKPAAVSDKPTLVVSEKVLVSPLVTLDLPLTAFLPEEYVPDETVRLSVYLRMVEAQEPEEVRALRQELRDRFGEPPLPAVHLLTWLQIKALALEAGVTSVITTNEEFVVRLPIVDAATRERLRRRFGRDATVKVGPQFIRLDRRALRDDWVDKLTTVLDVLGD